MAHRVYDERMFKYVSKEEFDEMIGDFGYLKLQEMETNRRTRADKLREMYNARDFPALLKEEWDREVKKGTNEKKMRALHEERKKQITETLNAFSMKSRFTSPGEKPKELRIAMVGKTGDGKSSVANTVISRGKVFREDSSAMSVTTTSKMHETTWRGINVRVVDTPGLQDTHRPRQEIMREIARIIQIFPEGIHCFLYVINLSRHRFTKEDRQVLSDIKELFGVDIVKYVVLVFSHADTIKGLKIVEYKRKNIAEDPRGPKSKFLQELGDRILAVDNTVTTDYAKSANQNRLLSYVLDTVSRNGSLYTNRLFEKVHGMASGNLKDEISQIVRAYYDKHPEILGYDSVPNDLLQHVKSKVGKGFIMEDALWRGKILRAINALNHELLSIYKELDSVAAKLSMCSVV